jgi:hypothetical protein
MAKPQPGMKQGAQPSLKSPVMLPGMSARQVSEAAYKVVAEAVVAAQQAAAPAPTEPPLAPLDAVSGMPLVSTPFVEVIAPAPLVEPVVVTPIPDTPTEGTATPLGGEQ